MQSLFGGLSIALVLAILAVATPTTPHRARQSPQPCTYYACPATLQTSTLDYTTYSNGQLNCNYGSGNCYYAASNLQYLSSRDESDPVGASSPGCLYGVCVYQPPCNTAFTCATLSTNGYYKVSGGPTPLIGIGAGLTCIYQSPSSADSITCEYQASTGELVNGPPTCPSVGCTATSRRGWEGIAPRELQSSEDILEDLRPW
ncbi:hypothetical protein CALVIDRAFT_535356 [Calocera viscosa TUFC12733]|uniref:Uncharacterized protein n=1 Tax=Calocera viscosa (strain TUFC12733) TaxID=1330018 RepID=A0A167NZX0_CALVF|nr:hypothetical protein CALVIDRAFT_535356 [Calocera viscosa TUFC12733]